ncbi:oligosaccharide flippase family protein [Cyclobacterium jeungdonense]|uniref:Oligosaccharide flippase family protein n=1 Tax=Cyclobacterium jeungdonense TaxID=708087 RepID=A0ABT8C311_9BACT|nr:oligosaccharide flippase family protein [Cyclobacterium jeungdonense]MDN3687160.1 oligosaccharide flippase family protein [Cyclobacterium jeungdonense]
MLERISRLPFFHLLQNKSIRNFVFLFLIQSSNILISLLAMPVLIRAIGVAEFGLVNLSFSVILLFNVLVSYGYNLSGPRSIALAEDNPEALSQTFSEIIWSKSLLAAIALLFILTLGMGFGFFKDYLFILSWSTILLFSEATTTIWFFQGKESLHWASLANVFGKLLYLGLILVLVNDPSGSYLANFLLGATAILTNLVLLGYIHFGLKIRLRWPDIRSIWPSWKKNLLLFFSGMTSHLAVNGGVIILSFFASAQVLGLYGMAERVAMVLRIAPTLITQAAYPRASILFYQDSEKCYRFLRKVQWASLAVGLAIGGVVHLFASDIIQLVSGKNLEEAVAILKILAFLPLLAGLNIVNMLIILVTDEKKTLFHSTWGFCVYMLGASLLLTHYYGGTGLAVALLSTELAAYLFTSALLWKSKAPILTEYYRGFFSRHSYS